MRNCKNNLFQTHESFSLYFRIIQREGSYNLIISIISSFGVEEHRVHALHVKLCGGGFLPFNLKPLTNLTYLLISLDSQNELSNLFSLCDKIGLSICQLDIKIFLITMDPILEQNTTDTFPPEKANQSKDNSNPSLSLLPKKEIQQSVNIGENLQDILKFINDSLEDAQKVKPIFTMYDCRNIDIAMNILSEAIIKKKSENIERCIDALKAITSSCFAMQKTGCFSIKGSRKLLDCLETLDYIISSNLKEKM